MTAENLVLQAARETGTIQYKPQNATYSFQTPQWQNFVPTNWWLPSTAFPSLSSHFNKPRLVTLKNTTNWTRLYILRSACQWCLNLPIDISVMFVPWHRVPEGTRPSPSFSHRHAGGEPGNKATIESSQGLIEQLKVGKRACNSVDSKFKVILFIEITCYRAPRHISRQSTSK